MSAKNPVFGPVVVVLGAGASKVLGFPIQNEVWRFVQNNSRGHTKKVFSKIKKLFGKDIEKALTLLELGDIGEARYSPKSHESEHSTLLFEFRNAIAEVFGGVQLREEGVDLYKNLLKVLTRTFSNLTFISLNWDLGLETVLAQLKINSNYRLLFDGPEETIARVSNSKKEIEVLKLHGSINWRLCHYCKALSCTDHVEREMFSLPVTFSGLTRWSECIKFARTLVPGNTVKLPQTGIISPGIYKQESCSNCGRFGADTIITPPSLRKVVDLSSLDSVARAAHSALRDAETIIFIGYSLRDADYDFLHLMKAADIQRNRMVLVFDRKEVYSRIRKLFITNYPELLADGSCVPFHMGFLNSRSVKRLQRIFSD